MTYETEWDQMVAELNEALAIEPNASHMQRLVTILNMRSQALRLVATELKLRAAEEDRDKAEQRLLDVLNAHADFIQDAICQAQVLHTITEDFRKGILARTASDTMDAAYLAMAKLREEKDDGARFDLDDVIDELKIAQGDYSPLSKPTKEEVDEGLASLRAKLHADDASDVDDPDPMGMVDLEPKPEVRMDFPGPHDKKVSSETTTDFVDERNRVPFNDQGVNLVDDTRGWMEGLADGTTVASSSIEEQS